MVITCNNEVCSRSDNAVSKSFWQKEVLPEQRISYCAGIYKLFKDQSEVRVSSDAVVEMWTKVRIWEVSVCKSWVFFYPHVGS